MSRIAGGRRHQAGLPLQSLPEPAGDPSRGAGRHLRDDLRLADDPLQREHPRAAAGDLRSPRGAMGRPGRAAPRPAAAGVRRRRAGRRPAARPWPPSIWRRSRSSSRSWSAGKKEGKIPAHVDSEQVAWFITGFAFAGDVSQTMGFKHFLDPEISGRWLDVMFASFVAPPEPGAPRGRSPHRPSGSSTCPDARYERRVFALTPIGLPPLLSAVAFWKAQGGSVKTYSAKPGEVQRNWWVVDADGKNLGRLASEIAIVLRGKNKPQYTPAYRHRGLRRRGQCGEDRGHRQQADRQDVLPPLRLPGWPQEPRRSATCFSAGRPKCCARPSRACCPRTGSPRSS